ncbi:MAG: map 2 [Candidatus Saccharibacteria bacterium]|nr:map 2 [Candidatus Saccharibacteria bacterium]
MFTKVKTAAEIHSMQESGKLLATVLATLKQALEPGMSTQDLAEMAKRELRSTDGQPTFLGYYGFPDVICISVNDEVVHGIPNAKKTIQSGDIVSLDFGVTYNGMITDSAISVIAGEPKNSDHVLLVERTEASMLAGIAAAHSGVRVGDIAHNIEEQLKGYGIVRELVGHGVGHQLHEDPNIPNYGRAGSGPTLHKGMTIAIEPMATLGDHRVYIENDGWTVRTVDGSWAAHFEHTVLLTEDGAEILTQL